MHFQWVPLIFTLDRPILMYIPHKFVWRACDQIWMPKSGAAIAGRIWREFLRHNGNIDVWQSVLQSIRCRQTDDSGADHANTISSGSHPCTWHPSKYTEHDNKHAHMRKTQRISLYTGGNYHTAFPIIIFTSNILIIDNCLQTTPHRMLIPRMIEYILTFCGLAVASRDSAKDDIPVLYHLWFHQEA